MCCSWPARHLSLLPFDQVSSGAREYRKLKASEVARETAQIEKLNATATRGSAMVLASIGSVSRTRDARRMTPGGRPFPKPCHRLSSGIGLRWPEFADSVHDVVIACAISTSRSAAGCCATRE